MVKSRLLDPPKSIRITPRVHVKREHHLISSIPLQFDILDLHRGASNLDRYNSSNERP